MATKRPAPDAPQSSRSHNLNKRQKPNGLGKRSFKKAFTVNELKSRIRSLKRLLENQEDLPADVCVEKERALQTAEHELAETERAKSRSDLIAKWHKVRFFERQKATRRLKKARNALRAAVEADDAKETVESLGREVDECEIDVNYTLYYPLDVEYVRLWPWKEKREQQGSGSEGNEDADQNKEIVAQREGDEDMRALVQRSMADGSLEALKNGKFTSQKADKTSKKEAHGSMRKRRHVLTEKRTGGGDDDESGGAFFE